MRGIRRLETAKSCARNTGAQNSRGKRAYRRHQRDVPQTACHPERMAAGVAMPTARNNFLDGHQKALNGIPPKHPGSSEACDWLQSLVQDA